MTNRYLTKLLPILALSAFGFADQASPEEETSIDKAKELQSVQYHNRMVVFAPFHQAYERIKPDAIYAGAEGYLVPLLDSKKEGVLLDAELRMGYNFFFNGRDHLTPFAGLGYFQDHFKFDRDHRHRPGVVYGAVGFLYNHEFDKTYNLGVNVKFLTGGAVEEKHFDWGSAIVGTDIAIPATFRFGKNRNWDYRLEPFNLYLHGSNASENYFGFRNTVAYRF